MPEFSSIDWTSLCLGWLEELYSAAEARASGGGARNIPRPGMSRQSGGYIQQSYAKCIATLKSLPDLRISRPSELKEQRGFGPKICETLEKKAQAYCKDNDIEYEPVPQPAPREAARPSKPSKAKPYVPKYDSTTYHVLLCLRVLDLRIQGAGIGRSELMRALKPRLMASFESRSGKQIPAITPCMGLLTRKEYVYEYNRRYFLTDAGKTAADSLLALEQQATGDTAPATLASASTSVVNRALPQVNGFVSEVWSPDDYTIKLILDTREVLSKDNRSGFKEALELNGADVELTPLAAGDILWVAEHTNGQRAVLDYIVERKTLADLVSSIIDGRFVEQKQRLEKSSIEHVIYLVEMVGSVELINKHSKRIQTAMSQIITHHGFFLKQTASQNDTTFYLAEFTKHLKLIHSKMPLEVVVPHVNTFQPSLRRARSEITHNKLAIDYDTFNTCMAKTGNHTVGEIFIIMLAAVKGISIEKATAIQQIYLTPVGLWKAYQRLDSENDKIAMVYWATKDNIPRRRIRLELSEILYHVWGRI